MNYSRRVLGVLLCFAPVWLIILSLAWAHAGHIRHIRESKYGLGMVVVAIMLGVLNLYLAMIRPALFQRRPGYRNISGFPVIGTLLVIAGIVCAFGNVPAGILAIVAVLLDTGGLPWFLLWTWHDYSLWDTR